MAPFILATIPFKAILETPGTDLTFNLVIPRRTKVTSGLDTVTGGTEGLTISVTLPPVVADDLYTVDEDSSLVVPAATGVLANDSDPEGAALSVGLVSDVNSGTLSIIADGSFTYIPAPNFNGADTFTYQANDGTPGSDTLGTVTITVTPINDPPTAIDEAFSLAEDTVLNVAGPGVLANDSDVDGDRLTAIYVGLSGPSDGTLALNADGSFTYTPNADFNGADSFSYVANDGAVDSNQATVSLNIAPNLQFVLDLQGRTSPEGWVMPFEVDLYAPGVDPTATPPMRSYSPTTSTDGTFELNFPPEAYAVYDIRAKGQHTLRVLLATVDLTNPPSVPVNLGVQVEGDFNGDNIVDISDYSAVTQLFGRLTPSLSPAEKPADFNQDGVVDIVDYSMVVVNFGEFGVPPFGP